MTFVDVSEIEFTARKSCFISIPKTWNLRPNEKISVFRIKSLKCEDEVKEEVLMSWCGDTTNGNTIHISGVFANKLGFSHKQQVLVTYVPILDLIGQTNARKCYLKPITENDWEILSMNSTFIETNLLNQIRVLTLGQVFPVWITSQSNVCLFVECFQLLPNNSKVIVLNQLSEVVVCPPNTSRNMIADTNDNAIVEPNDMSLQSISKSNETNYNTNQTMLSSMFGFVKSLVMNSSDENVSQNPQSIQSNDDKNSENGFPIESQLNFYEVLRVIPFVDETDNNNKDIVNTVYISSDYFIGCETKYFVANLTHLLSPNEMIKENQKNNEKKEIDSNKQLADLTFKETTVLVCSHHRCPVSSIFVCNSLRRQLGLSITSRLLLTTINENHIPIIQKLTLCPINVMTQLTDDVIRSDLIRLLNRTSMKMLFLTNGSFIHLCGYDFFVVTTNTSQTTAMFMVTLAVTTKLSIEFSEPFMSIQKPFCEVCLPIQQLKDIDKKLKSNFLSIQFQNKPLAGFDDILKKCLHSLIYALKLDELSQYFQNKSAVNMSSMLIYGQKGCGKSHLIYSLMERLSSFPYYVYFHVIDCHSLKSKRIDSILKNWNNCLAECLYRQPSVLVFEDMDAIASMPSKPGQEMSSEALYSERIALLFVDFIDKINRKDISFGNQIAVIVTSKSNKTLQTNLVQTRGKHVFEEMIELMSPDLKQRFDIITNLLTNRLNVSNIDSHISVNLKDIAIRCKGYQPLDISTLLERALHNCYLKLGTDESTRQLILSEDNFNSAFDGFSPTSLRGLDLELKSSRRLSEVGGLSDVKKCLMETLLWSIRYPTLFSKLPIKAQSSILLFGAPGTGKTLVIEAIANECNINFIGIKGPELLSKYVGASEQSVRDLFARADNAKPCILFFDEFDALAPRRGHDSTGVTDRVVNQLLTQMDGFEELGSGVYVLAATSRPDLIDPALLRPGRFDKCLCCPLPNQNERLDILNVMSAKLTLAPDIDLDVIAQQTNHYTGADLSALLYSSQLEALHESLNENSKQFVHQIKTSAETTDSQYLEFIASYMPSLSSGLKRDIDSCDRQKLINEIDVYLPNTKIGGNVINNDNSGDLLTPQHTSAHNALTTTTINDLIAIQQKHILTALSSSKPSISETEIKKFETFLSSGGQSFQTFTEMSQKRVTLA
ncbi:uncharacterized protein LOC128964876 isoform X2 [Oppia nitens]|uniref:uncharacterized protein LOC128964876 isoform X2 n=1 Tax=Oppia nitens TaxID=1686743 RepID=UPI0023D99F14|nr:uncharacterized protein LOC128964876 isoform X2 [Oppia nitens]